MDKDNELQEFDKFTQEDLEEIIKLMIEAYENNEGID